MPEEAPEEDAPVGDDSDSEVGMGGDAQPSMDGIMSDLNKILGALGGKDEDEDMPADQYGA